MKVVFLIPMLIFALVFQQTDLLARGSCTSSPVAIAYANINVSLGTKVMLKYYQL